MTPSALPVLHRRRLNELWRGAGWPCHDAIELELLAGGLLQRHWDGAGHETLRVTDSGLAALAAARRRSQAALSAHEALVGRVAMAMQRAGRIVWRGLAMRAALPPVAAADLKGAVEAGAGLPGVDAAEPAAAAGPRWVVARPDVFSIRHTTQEAYLEPIAHEIKVSRSDLLADLKRPDKGLAYAALAGECWYVVRAGLCRPEELPPDYGLMAAHDDGRLEVLRAAPRRPWRAGFSWWMTLARAVPERPEDDEAQAGLAPVVEPASP